MQQRSIVNVQHFLNEHPFSGFQWLVFAMCFVVVLLDGFDTAAIGYIAPSLIKEWNVARPALGPVLSAALFGLAFGALAAGPLSDWLGRRVLLIASVAVFGVACLTSAFSSSRLCAFRPNSQEHCVPAPPKSTSHRRPTRRCR